MHVFETIKYIKEFCLPYDVKVTRSYNTTLESWNPLFGLFYVKPSYVGKQFCGFTTPTESKSKNRFALKWHSNIVCSSE